MKVNYIVAFYIGNNRGYESYKDKFRIDPTFFLDKHINFFSSGEIADIDLISFVFNSDISEYIKQLILEKTSKLTIKTEVIFRDNAGFSYGIWNDIITKNLYDYDYFFLIEDDYIPSTALFAKNFIKFSSNTVPYICGFADLVTEQTNPDITSKGIYTVPSISNGIIKATCCRDIFEKYNTIFKLNYDSNYPSAWENQICFYKYFFDEGYMMGDILSEFSSPFMYVGNNTLKIFGDDTLPSLIIPISV